MDTRQHATKRVASAARDLYRRSRKIRAPGQDRGFICALIAGRWCGGWYETYFSAVKLVSGRASATASRLADLPARFEALFLLCKLVKSQAPGIVCSAPVR